jgi:hypothetical protein
MSDLMNSFAILPSNDAGETGEPRRSGMITVDENGDAVFRFRLRPEEAATDEALGEFYRAEIYDLLKIVRLYFRGQPLLVDAFAFRNEPERIQPLQKRKAPAGPAQES